MRGDKVVDCSVLAAIAEAGTVPKLKAETNKSD